MSKLSIATGKKKLAEKRQKLIESLWSKEELDKMPLWHRKLKNGFTTMPRTMPQIHRIMDKHAGSGKPISGTNLALWCNVFDESFLEIKEKPRYAFESGFSGERAVTTWAGRMRKLEELGFITSKSGVNGEFSFIMLLNPLLVIKGLYENKPKDALYNALVSRMSDVGANFDI